MKQKIYLAITDLHSRKPLKDFLNAAGYDVRALHEHSDHLYHNGLSGEVLRYLRGVFSTSSEPTVVISSQVCGMDTFGNAIELIARASKAPTLTVLWSNDPPYSFGEKTRDEEALHPVKCVKKHFALSDRSNRTREFQDILDYIKDFCQSQPQP